MRQLILTAGLLAGLAGLPASAGQPIEESLVECAVMVELLLGEQSFIPGEDRSIDIYVGAAASMRRKASEMADADFVTRVADQKRDVWHDRWDSGGWDNPANRGDLQDWWRYCFKLADHLKLTP